MSVNSWKPNAETKKVILKLWLEMSLSANGSSKYVGEDSWGPFSKDSVLAVPSEPNMDLSAIYWAKGLYLGKLSRSLGSKCRKAQPNYSVGNWNG